MCVFQSNIYTKFLENVNNINTKTFYTFDNNGVTTGKLVVMIVKQTGFVFDIFTSRVIVLGGPVFYDKVDRLRVLDNILFQLILEFKRKAIFIQFRNFNKWSEAEIQVFNKHGFVYRERQNILIPLSSEQNVLKGMSESKRRQLRLAQKNGTIARAPESIEEVKEFYQIVKKLYKYQIRKPLPDFSFFKEFYHYSQKGLGIIRVIEFDNKIIGGVLAPVTPNQTIYYWYVAGLDQEYKNNYPSLMAVWSLIEYGLQNNIKYLDFMGIGKPGQDYGVRDFKMRFSKNIVDYGRFGRRNNKFFYWIAETGFNVLRAFSKV